MWVNLNNGMSVVSFGNHPKLLNVKLPDKKYPSANLITWQHSLPRFTVIGSMWNIYKQKTEEEVKEHLHKCRLLAEMACLRTRVSLCKVNFIIPQPNPIFFSKPQTVLKNKYRKHAIIVRMFLLSQIWWYRISLVRHFANVCSLVVIAFRFPPRERLIRSLMWRRMQYLCQISFQLIRSRKMLNQLES